MTYLAKPIWILDLQNHKKKIKIAVKKKKTSDENNMADTLLFILIPWAEDPGWRY